MEKEKFKLLFYLKRGTQDKNGKSPIMGRISAGRSMVQFSCKCSCTPRLWDLSLIHIFSLYICCLKSIIQIKQSHLWKQIAMTITCWF